MTDSIPAPRVTVAIPLFRSAPFVDDILRNVAAMPAHGVEILISDRHCLDDALSTLAHRLAQDPRVRILRAHDAIGWTEHINLLLQAARGEYFRVLPHDDISPPGSLEALVAALDADPAAILAYGPTRAVDVHGQPVSRTAPSAPPTPAEYGWTLGGALDMFWLGSFDGAFKGLVRTGRLREVGHRIVATRDLVFAERTFLFGICLLGPLRFVPEALYVKRYHAGSVHAQWRPDARHTLSATRVMMGYVAAYVVEPRMRAFAMGDLAARAATVVTGAVAHRVPLVGRPLARAVRGLRARVMDSWSLRNARFPAWRTR